jgi:hypothetical protein
MMVEEVEQEQETRTNGGRRKSKSLKSRSATPATGSEAVGGRRDKGLLHTFPAKV